MKILNEIFKKIRLLLSNGYGFFRQHPLLTISFLLPIASLLYFLIMGIMNTIHNNQTIGIKYFGIAFSGFVAFGTILLASSTFYSIKELRNKEENRKNQIIKMFFNQIEKHLEDLRIISNRIILDEMQGIEIFSDTEIQYIFYDFYNIHTVFEDTTGYNSLFSEPTSPCEPIFRKYYHSFYNFIQDTKNINNGLISIFGLYSDKNPRSIFGYMHACNEKNTLQNISDAFLKGYEDYCGVNHSNPIKLKKFINVLHTPHLLNIGLSEPFQKLKSFIEYPILLILLGYESLFCIMKEHGIKDTSSIINNYKTIEKNISDIGIRISNRSLPASDVIRESLAKIKSINENYKSYL